MSYSAITYHDRVTLRPLNELAALHEPDMTLQVVPAHEVDADHGRISAEAPLGRALLHRRRGETVTIQVQGRSLSMLVLNVEKRQAAPV